jgi:hypothetical protein
VFGAVHSAVSQRLLAGRRQTQRQDPSGRGRPACPTDRVRLPGRSRRCHDRGHAGGLCGRGRAPCHDGQRARGRDHPPWRAARDGGDSCRRHSPNAVR